MSNDDRPPVELTLTPKVQTEIETGFEKLKDKLGSGAFGEVRKITIGSNNYAIKRIKFSNENQKMVEREFANIQSMKSNEGCTQFILCFRGSFFSKHQSGRYNFGFLITDMPTESIKWKTLEQCCINLGENPQSQSYGIENNSHWVENLYSAIQSIHKKGIVHRDIKPSNILIHENMTDILLIDFGSSCLENLVVNDSSCVGIAGSPLYMHPYKNKSYKDGDWWAFGLVVFYFITAFLKNPYEKFKPNIPTIVFRSMFTIDNDKNPFSKINSAKFSSKKLLGGNLAKKRLTRKGSSRSNRKVLGGEGSRSETIENGVSAEICENSGLSLKIEKPYHLFAKQFIEMLGGARIPCFAKIELEYPAILNNIIHNHLSKKSKVDEGPFKKIYVTTSIHIFDIIDDKIFRKKIPSMYKLLPNVFPDKDHTSYSLRSSRTEKSPRKSRSA
jgi:serine/threonine protein kinase